MKAVKFTLIILCLIGITSTQSMASGQGQQCSHDLQRLEKAMKSSAKKATNMRVRQVPKFGDKTAKSLQKRQIRFESSYHQKIGGRIEALRSQAAECGAVLDSDPGVLPALPQLSDIVCLKS